MSMSGNPAYNFQAMCIGAVLHNLWSSTGFASPLVFGFAVDRPGILLQQAIQNDCRKIGVFGFLDDCVQIQC